MRSWKRPALVAAAAGALVLAGVGAMAATTSTPTANCTAHPTVKQTTFTGNPTGGSRISVVCNIPNPPAKTVTATATATATVTKTVTASPSQSPTSTPTSPSSSPTQTPTNPGVWECTNSNPSGNCGPFPENPKLVMSNGFNTYVGNDCWADPTCKQTVSANGPDDWQVVANEPAGNTSVKTYPDIQQMTNNYCNGGWGCPRDGDTPIDALADLHFDYALTMPPASSGVIAQAAYDIWTSDPDHTEIMVWVDNDNRGNGGATFDAEYTTADGSQWTLYHFGAEIIWSLGQRGTYAQRPSYDDVPIHELMQYLVDHGFQQSTSKVSQIDFGWEVCSTGGVPQTFTVTDYSITAN